MFTEQTVLGKTPNGFLLLVLVSLTHRCVGVIDSIKLALKYWQGKPGTGRVTFPSLPVCSSPEKRTRKEIKTRSFRVPIDYFPVTTCSMLKASHDGIPCSLS